jgi:hypothetical protein
VAPPRVVKAVEDGVAPPRVVKAVEDGAGAVS